MLLRVFSIAFIPAIEEHSLSELPLVVKDGAHQATLALSEKDREILGLEGLSPFLPWS